MTIPAIETEYAGHRFRSRLEARWAVLFDNAGIQWQYEPQGYEINVAGEKRPYLPDFWLANVNGGIWCEVKGSPDGLDVPLLAHAAHPEYGLPQDLTGRPVRGRKVHRLLILGPVPPKPHSLLTPLHCCLTWDSTYLRHPAVTQTAVLLLGAFILGTDIESPIMADGTMFGSKEDLWETICGEIKIPRIEPLYQRARKARFEHGKTPLPPEPPEPEPDGPSPIADLLRERLAALQAERARKPGAA